MTNLVLFFVTTVVYYVFGWFVFSLYDLYPHKKALALCALLALPVNINGHVFTIVGNAQGEKGVYSLMSFYQQADQGDTLALAFAGYQQAGEDALVGFGLSVYQQAKRDAEIILGLSGYQRAGKDAIVGFGLSVYQQAKEKTEVFFGLSGYQQADKTAITSAGLTLCQRVQDKTRVFAAFSSLRADNKVGAK